jgi:hypothetical protein
VKKRHAEEYKKTPETLEIENEANTARKKATDDGQKKEYSVEDVSKDGEDYPLVEGRKRTPRAPKDKSNVEPSPLNETPK